MDTDRRTATAAAPNGIATAEPAVIDLTTLKELSVAELTKVARDLDIPHATGLRKQELIFEILRGKAAKVGMIFSEGVLEVLPDGFGFLRARSTTTCPARTTFTSRPGRFASSACTTATSSRGRFVRPRKANVTSRCSGSRRSTARPPTAGASGNFEDLTPLHPQEHIGLEADPDNMNMRIVDLVTPIGNGQRMLIVAPPRTGKTMLLQKIANAITTNHPEVY